MKPPKEPKTFRYPRLYWRPEGNDSLHSRVSELIIVYPETHLRSERTSRLGTFYPDSGLVFKACWDFNLTPKQKIKKMKKYAKYWGFKTVFLGEIK